MCVCVCVCVYFFFLSNPTNTHESRVCCSRCLRRAKFYVNNNFLKLIYSYIYRVCCSGCLGRAKCTRRGSPLTNILWRPSLKLLRSLFVCVCVGGCISICVGGCISGCISRCMCIYIYEQTAYEDHVAGVGSEQRKNKNKNKNKNKTRRSWYCACWQRVTRRTWCNDNTLCEDVNNNFLVNNIYLCINTTGEVHIAGVGSEWPGAHGR